MTATYASIGISRIQAHLSRSRRLWGRRGASEELVLLTTTKPLAAPKGGEPSLVATVLARHPRVRLNAAAPAVDGEVAVWGRDEDEVLAMAEDYVTELQARLPALNASIRWQTTTKTYAQSLRTPLTDLSHRDFLPHIYEYPLVRLCSLCGIDGAMIETERHEETLVLCPDCAQRLDRPGRWLTLNGGPKPTTRPDEALPSRFTAEYDLLTSINNERSTPVAAVAHFKDLAALVNPNAQGRTRTYRHHLALLYADGNGLGVLFERLRREAAAMDDTSTLIEVSTAIKKATHDALLHATRAVMVPDETKLPVIPHIVGGDDVLVSLPAERAWTFLTQFLTRLSEQLTTTLEHLASSKLPSMSAGLVICHHAFPFANQVELAERLCQKAKEHVRGEGWSFTWLDVTTEGTEQPAGRVPWRLADLEHQSKALALLADKEFAASSEASIRRTLAVPHEEDRTLRMNNLAARMPAIKDFLDAVSPPVGQVKDDAIADLISLQRWFT